MGIIDASMAFLEALDGGRSGSGQAPVVPAPSPVQASAPLAEEMIKLQVRLADLELQLKTIRPYVDAEVASAKSRVEGLRTAVRRIEKFLESGEGESDAADDVPGGDAPASGSGGVLPMRGSVEGPHHPSPAEIREAARRALGS